MQTNTAITVVTVVWTRGTRDIEALVRKHLHHYILITTAFTYFETFIWAFQPQTVLVKQKSVFYVNHVFLFMFSSIFRLPIYFNHYETILRERIFAFFYLEFFFSFDSIGLIKE